MSNASTPPRDEGTVHHWQDASGHEWSVVPSARSLTLHGKGELFTISRPEWDSRIDYNDVGGRVVFRFDLPDRQVGFMISKLEAEKFLRGLEWTNEHAVASAARLQSLTQRAHHWPTVTGWSMGGLLAAALSFLPGIGFAFVLLALACMLVSTSKARSNSRLVHNNILMLTTGALLIIATTANIFSLATIFSESTSHARAVLADPRETLSTASKVIAVLIVLLSLSVHEAAHAVTAWWCGDEGPLQRGRITLNPIAHIDPIGTILVPAVLAFSGGMVFGWAKPVMVSLHGVPNPRRANILISAAGPCSNFLLGLVFLSLYLSFGCAIYFFAPEATVANFTNPISNVHMTGFSGAAYFAQLAVFLKWGFLINMLLCFFNLIPLPPLDGGHILGSLFPSTVGEFYRKIGRYSFLILLALIYFGFVQVLLLPGIMLIRLGFGLVSSITGL